MDMAQLFHTPLPDFEKKTCSKCTPLHLQFTKAVEAKQVAQQDAERARFVVMKADQVGR